MAVLLNCQLGILQLNFSEMGDLPKYFLYALEKLKGSRKPTIKAVSFTLCPSFKKTFAFESLTELMYSLMLFPVCFLNIRYR